MSGIISAIFGGRKRYEYPPPSAARRDRRPAGKDRRPWAPNEEALITECDRRTGRPLRPDAVMTALVAEDDGYIVTVVVGKGRKASYETFWSQTGWDASGSDSSPWRLAHAR